MYLSCLTHRICRMVTSLPFVIHRDLAPRDISGTSDPFARVIFNNHSAETSVSCVHVHVHCVPLVLRSHLLMSILCLTFRTKKIYLVYVLGFQIIKKTRFPHWGETLELELELEELSEEGFITVEVWDWDMVGKNDFLGKVTTIYHY